METERKVRVKSEKFLFEEKVERDEKFLPPAAPVYVQCPGFRCMAYRDERGQWRNYHSRELLTNVLGLVAYQSNNTI